GICDWVLDGTGGNETAARAADWLVGRPLAILAILAGAWLLRTAARWVIRRAMHRVLVPPAVVTKGLSGLSGARIDAVTERIDLARRRARAESLGSALAGVVSTVIWTIAFVFVLRVLGVELTP